MIKTNTRRKKRYREHNSAIISIEPLIITIRSTRVILDNDLARIYGVSTARLNQQVKRNLDRFPNDFLFRLAKKEFGDLMLQFATSKNPRGGRRKLPYVFTEYGAIMAANVLNSPRAVQMSVYVVRAFIKMREALSANKALTEKLIELENKLTNRLDTHEKAIVHILKEIKKLTSLPKPPKHRPIGFQIEKPDGQ
jgi:phage regulator Rha-like protein